MKLYNNKQFNKERKLKLKLKKGIPDFKAQYVFNNLALKLIFVHDIIKWDLDIMRLEKDRFP